MQSYPVAFSSSWAGDGVATGIQRIRLVRQTIRQLTAKSGRF